jgi:hypothetical protein
MLKKTVNLSKYKFEELSMGVRFALGINITAEDKNKEEMIEWMRGRFTEDQLQEIQESMDMARKEAKKK